MLRVSRTLPVADELFEPFVEVKGLDIDIIMVPIYGRESTSKVVVFFETRIIALISDTWGLETDESVFNCSMFRDAIYFIEEPDISPIAGYYAHFWFLQSTR